MNIKYKMESQEKMAERLNGAQKSVNGWDLVFKFVKNRIGSLVEEADKYTKSMNEDYEHFFDWYAEDMYKVQRELACYRALNKVLGIGNLEKSKTYIKNRIGSLTDDLLNGSIRMNSTSEMSNLAHALELEVKQELREKFIMLFDFIERDKQDEV